MSLACKCVGPRFEETAQGCHSSFIQGSTRVGQMTQKEHREPAAERLSESIVSSWLLVFGLAVAWAAVLIPDVVRRNASSRNNDTMAQFSRNLSSLQRSAPVGSQRAAAQMRSARPVIDLRETPTPAPAPAGRSQRPASAHHGRSAVQQRRQEVLTGLVAAALLSFLASVSLGGFATTIHAAIDVMFVVYLVALLVVTRREKLRSQVNTLYPSQPQLTSFMPAMAPRQRVSR